ncbi:hypothetical protein L1987_32969 [Smallanthus sonchifolius]|uniref:Uncharacterized protein n=1 Tax=Smallanthus sonchifolius TaxID=185202 RepID=A0ACB9HQF2_9ASTR|nr:hypothetical protein L1987_32969 [Smallanthus sonchifolius]
MNDYKSKELKNIKVENLKSLVENFNKEQADKKEKTSDKTIQLETVEQYGKYKNILYEIAQKKQSIIVESQLNEVTPSHNEEVVIPTVDEDPEERKRLLDEFFEIGYNPDLVNNSSKTSLRDVYVKMKVRDAEKAKIMKERDVKVYSSSTTADTRSISEEKKGSLFVQSSLLPQETERKMATFDIELENFTKETLREGIVSWRYDMYKDLYVIIRTKGKKNNTSRMGMAS